MVSYGIHALITLIALIIISSIFVGLQFYLRWCQRGAFFSYHHIVVCLTLICSIVYVILDSQVLVYDKLWETNPSFNDFGDLYLTLGKEKIEWVAKTMYIATFPYYTSLWGVKITLILFYYTIMPPSRAFRSLRWTLHATTFITIASWFGCVFLQIFWCFPVKKNWDISDPNGTCVSYGNNYLPYRYTVAMHIVTDIIIFCLPFPIIRSLKLPRRKFIAVISVFLLAILNIIVTVIRLVAIQIGFPVYAVTILTGLEQSLGIIVVCCPAFKGLLSRWITSRRPRTIHGPFGAIEPDYARHNASSYSKKSTSSQNALNEPRSVRSHSEATTGTTIVDHTSTIVQGEKGADIQMQTFFMDSVNDDSDSAHSIDEEEATISPLRSRARGDSDTIAGIPAALLPSPSPTSTSTMGGSGSHSPRSSLRLSTCPAPQRVSSIPSTCPTPTTLSPSARSPSARLSTYPYPSPEPWPPTRTRPRKSSFPTSSSESTSPESQSSSPLATPLSTPAKLSSFPMPSPSRARLSSFSSPHSASPTTRHFPAPPRRVSTHVLV